jgi:hypothetical protein
VGRLQPDLSSGPAHALTVALALWAGFATEFVANPAQLLVPGTGSLK